MKMGIFDFWKRENYDRPQLPTAKDLEEGKRQELQRQQEEHQQDLDDRLRNLDRFSGSLSEYVLLKREENLHAGDTIVPMSTGRGVKFVYDPIRSTRCDQKWMNDERELLTDL